MGDLHREGEDVKTIVLCAGFVVVIVTISLFTGWCLTISPTDGRWVE